MGLRGSGGGGQHLHPLTTRPSRGRTLSSWDDGAKNEDIRILQNYRDEYKDSVLGIRRKGLIKILGLSQTSCGTLATSLYLSEPGACG